MTSQVTADKFGDAMFREMYDLYAVAPLAEFKAWCCDAIKNNSVSSNMKKDEFQRSINAQSNKDRVVTKMTNFFLAGTGNKVFKVA